MRRIDPRKGKSHDLHPTAKNKHVGSDFDDFLREEKILEKTETIARKRVASYKTSKRRLAGNKKGASTMEKWNYRVVRKELTWRDWKTKKIRAGFMYDIHEAYYDNKGIISAITQNPVRITGETMEEMRHEWVMMAEAFGQPILDYSKFVKTDTGNAGKVKTKGNKKEGKPLRKSGASILRDLNNGETVSEILRKDSEIDHKKRFVGVAGLKKIIILLAEDYVGESRAKRRKAKD